MIDVSSALDRSWDPPGLSKRCFVSESIALMALGLIFSFWVRTLCTRCILDHQWEQDDLSVTQRYWERSQRSIPISVSEERTLNSVMITTNMLRLDIQRVWHWRVHFSSIGCRVWLLWIFLSESKQNSALSVSSWQASTTSPGRWLWVSLLMWACFHNQVYHQVGWHVRGISLGVVVRTYK